MSQVASVAAPPADGLSREERLKLKKKKQLAKKKENKKRKNKAEAVLPEVSDMCHSCLWLLLTLRSRVPQVVKREKVADADDKVEIEYVTEAVAAPEGMEGVLKMLMTADQLLAPRRYAAADEEAAAAAAGRSRLKQEEDQQLSDAAKRARVWKAEEAAAAVALTKRQRKEEKRFRVAKLKQMVSKPEVVDMHDVSSPDPLLLVHLKTLRNVVQVPRHWKQKRKYLQAKRGSDKIPFQLPEYIAATGVATMRAAQLEKDDAKKGKAKQREKMQGKGGKLDIDYRVLQDAFFKHQTKPNLTQFGDMYFEGKEFEVDVKTKRPGLLSAKLRAALGMTDNSPPPWLVNQQRAGPPPSYPNLRIPGLNAPLPPGCEYGFHAGGWGKPPLDQYDRPLFGDVYGVERDDPSTRGLMEQPNVDTSTRWGMVRAELAPSVLEEAEEEEEAAAETSAANAAEEEAAPLPAAVPDAAGATAAAAAASGAPSRLEQVDTLELRKKAASTINAMGVTPDSGEPKALARVLEQKQTSVGEGLYGSSFQYVIPGVNSKAAVIKSQKTGEEVITLDEADLEDLEGRDAGELLRRKFEAVLEAKESGKMGGGGGGGREMDEIHAQHAKKQKAKKKKAKTDADNFKF
jgi:splicing factor 3B subunit 2